MLRFLPFLHATEDGPGVTLVDDLSHFGEAVAASVNWSERHGDTEMSIWEYWKPLALNMWQATSRKK